MNNDIEKSILEKLKFRMAISNCKEEINTKMNVHPSINKEDKRVFLLKKKIIVATCASLALVSGIVVAANIEKINNKDRGLGEGIDTAIENGYIANPNAEDVDSNARGTNDMSKIEVNNMEAHITIENFLMDDVNLSTQILFEFDQQIKNVVNLDKVNAIELTDLIIRDEENRIIYGGNDEERFEQYCKENNLDYTFTEFNENYMNCGVNCFNVSHDKENNSVTIMYNMYTDKFPKSKKLYFSFEKIKMLEFNTATKMYDTIIITGEWNILVDVPEEMYNRTYEYYKVVSCDNPNFDIYTAKVTKTGFEIGVIISNIEQKEYPEELWVEERKIMDKYMDVVDKTEMNVELNELWSNPKYREMKEEYEKFIYPIQVTESFRGEKGKNSYVENANCKKYESTMSPSRNAKTYYVEGNKYDFYETFGMTKNDATDKIKVVLYFYGEPVVIELEKVLRQ